MEVNTSVSCISTFNNNTKISAALDDGKYLLTDINEEKIINTLDSGENHLILVKNIDDNLVYFNSENNLYRYDIRENKGKTLVKNSEQAILDFSILGNKFVLCLDTGEVLTSDNRTFHKEKINQVLPPLPNCAIFINDDKILCGFTDELVGEIDLNNNLFESYNTLDYKPSAVSPAIVYSLCKNSDYVVATTEVDVRIFQNKSLHTAGDLSHDKAIVTSSFAPCFGENIFVSGSSDGSLSIFDITNRKQIDIIESDECIQSVSANNLFIAVSDTSDNGLISVFKPEDFD